MVLVILEAQIDKAANQLDAASARIRDFAGRPGLHRGGPVDAWRTRPSSSACSTRPRPSTAAVAAQPPADPGQFQLAVFLARRGRIKDAIDLCEALWADPALRDAGRPPCASRSSATPMPPSTRCRPDASSPGSSGR